MDIPTKRTDKRKNRARNAKSRGFICGILTFSI